MGTTSICFVVKTYNVPSVRRAKKQARECKKGERKWEETSVNLCVGTAV